MRFALTFVTLVMARLDGDPLPRIAANDNRAPAGHESRGVLRLDLEARLGRWYPQAERGPSEPIEAFAERGHRPLVPGPLVRVRAGTRIEISLRNALASKTLVVYGLHERPGSPHDTIQIAPGAVREVRFTAGEPGTYFYWGSTTGDDIDTRKGIDSQLSGAIIVDSASSTPGDRKPLDRVFVIGVWHADRDTTGPKPWVERDQMVINGKSWPFTERFTYTLGDTVRWRWVNPTADAHTMHLHGFFYTIESAGTWSGDTVYASDDRRAVVTEMMLPGTTMAIRWVPHEPGNWLFHCHFPFHVSTFLSLNKFPTPVIPKRRDTTSTTWLAWCSASTFCRRIVSRLRGPRQQRTAARPVRCGSSSRVRRDALSCNPDRRGLTRPPATVSSSTIGRLASRPTPCRS